MQGPAHVLQNDRFFITALLLAVLGFGGIAGSSTGIAKDLFVIGLVLFVIFLGRGRPRP